MMIPYRSREGSIAGHHPGRARVVWTTLAVLMSTSVVMMTAACSAESKTAKVGAEESQPKLSVEVPTEKSLLLPFRVAGWAIDRGSAAGAGVEQVDVLDGGCQGQLVGVASYGIERPDVAASYGARFTNSGWQFIIEKLAVGDHNIGIRMLSSLSRQRTCETLTLTVR